MGLSEQMSSTVYMGIWSFYIYPAFKLPGLMHYELCVDRDYFKSHFLMTDNTGERRI